MTEAEQENAGEAGQKKRLTRRGAIIGGAVGGALALGVCYVALGGLWSRYLTLPAYAVMLFIFLASPIWVTVAAIRHRKEKHFAPWPVRILCGTILLAMFGGFGYLTGSQAFKAIENTPDRYLPLGEFKSPDGHQARADSVFFSHDGKHLFISTELAGSQTKMVEVESGKVVREFPFSRVALGPDGKLLCSNPMTADFRLVEVETGNDIWKRKAGSTLDTFPPTFLAFGPEGKIIVAGHSMGLYLLDAATGEVQRTLSEEKKHVSRSFLPALISSHPNTSLVAVLKAEAFTGGGPIVVWDTTTGKKVITLGPEAGTFSGFEFHPRKRIL
ncbi:MAG: hypothetical protein QF645_11875, partial [Planctomycetota bacterium]|nr:hypothetical protein [Planctomycetota bacterium]